MQTNRYNAQRVAYELWCIQEDRRCAGQPIDGMSTLIVELRQRHPRLDEVCIDQGVAHLLEQMYGENLARITQHRKQILQLRLPPVSTPSGY